MSLLDLPSEHRPGSEFDSTYELSLQVRDRHATVLVTGALNEWSGDAVAGIMSDLPPGIHTIRLMLSDVTSVDSLCVPLLIAAARERTQRWQCRVELMGASASVLRALGLTEPVAEAVRLDEILLA